MTSFCCSSVAAAAAAGTMIPTWKIRASMNATLPWMTEDQGTRGPRAQSRVYGTKGPRDLGASPNSRAQAEPTLGKKKLGPRIICIPKIISSITHANKCVYIDVHMYIDMHIFIHACSHQVDIPHGILNTISHPCRTQEEGGIFKEA